MTDSEPETRVVKAGPRRPCQPDGGIEGYRATRTLPLRVELARQLRRRRTLLALGFLAVLPLLLLLAFELGDGGRGRSRNLAELATSSGPNFAMFTLYVSTNFLLVVMVALFFGDTVASEASWASLKYLLAAPVPRGRLLRQKAVAAAILSAVGLLLLAAVAVAVGVAWFGAAEMMGTTGEAVPFSGSVVRVAVACAYLAVHLTWIAGLALWLSVSTDSPLGAVGGAVLVSIVSQMLDQITALGDMRAYLPTYHSRAWSDLLSADVDWTGMANGAFSGLVYATVFLLLAFGRFAKKDISS
ncbi:ABC transporter permease [Saccharopolyspora erythraea]|uniref:ABC transporter permease n=1 Tax=Saccharopolyspora erythraea TaxID=1836 RepID=UPI001BAC3D57|nr:ABC transporter permease [Saccharopolyspora erythraea]QUH00599.1 ABC transporter permease [Saccharopolyspora erythraea]